MDYGNEKKGKLIALDISNGSQQSIANYNLTSKMHQPNPINTIASNDHPLNRYISQNAKK